MRMKKFASVLLILALIVSCCACTSDPGESTPGTDPVQSQPATPAEVIGEMQTALGQTPCTKAQTVVNLAMTLDGGENGTLDLATKTTTDMTISQEPVSGYTVATVDVNYGGETSQTITENYTVIEDGEAIAYIQSSGIWLRMPSGQTAEDYADSASSVALNSSNVTIDESITQWNGTEVICLTSQLTGQDMQAVLTGVLNNFSALLTDSSVIQTADYSSVACENKFYLNKETYLPMAYELTFSGLNDVLNTIFAEIGATVDASNCTASATFISFDTQNEVVVPDGAKEKAEAWSRLLAEEPDNGDGTFTIREGMAIVDIVAPEGFEVTDKGYDHVYFKRDDRREIKYTMWYGGGSERFMSENDSRLNRYGNLPRDISREQMELTGDTLTFEADILGVTWESYEEGVMNAWAFLGNDGTTDYYIFIEVTDGYNDGLGGVKSADVTPDEFMAYLNAISISDLISE